MAGVLPGIRIPAFKVVFLGGWLLSLLNVLIAVAFGIK